MVTQYTLAPRVKYIINIITMATGLIKKTSGFHSNIVFGYELPWCYIKWCKTLLFFPLRAFPLTHPPGDYTRTDSGVTTYLSPRSGLF